MDARRDTMQYRLRRRRKKRWQSAVAALAAVVVFCTTYALILPAITAEQEAFCGREEHRHGDDCYETVLICDRKFEDAPAQEGHVHTSECYVWEPVLTCGEEERPDTYHEHAEGCYDEEGALLCEEPEVTEGHTHTEACYTEEEVLVCGEEEAEEAEPERHIHTETCYERVFACTKEEHTHSLICYSDKNADLESSGTWEATIPELTGKTAGENVALAARSQVGYRESERNYDVDDAGGKHGYTRYGAWYGYPYGEWCAMFASFCLHYAGVTSEEMPYASGCVYWVEALDRAGLYEAAGTYAPKQGDLAFFDTDRDGVSDHVGVITDVREDTVETVEGNISGAVARREHALTEETITGFGVLPQEQKLPDAPVVDGPDAEKPAEENPEETPEDPSQTPADETPEAPEEAPEEQEPELVCGLEEHTHTEDCYSAKGELICGLEEHAHTEACFSSEDGEEAPSYTDEELEEILRGFTEETERLEALEERTDEDVSQAEALLSRLEQAHQDGQLSDADFVALYERVQALLTDEYATIAEPCVGTNWILLRDSGWFEEYSGAAYAYDNYDDGMVLLAGSDAFETYSENAPSSVQIDREGSQKEQDGVRVSKTIEGTDLENVFDITLQVQTPQTINEVIKEPDMAVVIVMDISNTMNSNFGGSTRYKAAMDAAEQFLYKFADSNSLGTSKVGYVAFNTNAHQIFELQSCTSRSKAETLNNMMRTATGNIINAAGYGDAHSRFTNIEAGLKMGQDMLDGVSNKNKYIIFLSDGFPTTYISSGYSGYDPYDSTGSRFKDRVLNKPCTYGTSYSDEAAIQARNMANSIKSSGIKIFSIGVDVGGQTIQEYITQSEKADGFSVVDRTGTSYEIGDASSTESYKNWLRNSIGSGYYYDSTNLAGLEAAYEQIFETIKQEIETASKADWVASDPMPVGTQGLDAIEFIGLYKKDGSCYFDDVSGENKEQAENTAVYEADKDAISWDLKNSGFETRQNGNTTLYTYTLKYRVRLRNEDAKFSEGTVYDTNGTTTLQYRTVQTVNGVTSVSGTKRIDFPIPAVHGYLGELTFTKKDSRGSVLAGAEFTLSHNTEVCSICRGDNEHFVTVEDQVCSSGADGRVSFTNIPSGHTYTLTETKVPPGYAKNGSTSIVQVAYDAVTVTVTDVSGQPADWNDVIVNNTYYELPSTGGAGTVWTTVGGLTLALAAGCGLFQIKKRRRRENFF